MRGDDGGVGSLKRSSWTDGERRIGTCARVACGCVGEGEVGLARLKLG